MTRGTGWRISCAVTPNTCVTIRRGRCDPGSRPSRAEQASSAPRSSACVAIVANERPTMKFFAAVLTLACASGGILVAKPVLTTSVVSAECYSLAYSDPVKNVSAALFPPWIELFPGTDSGSVAARPHPAIGKYSGWKRIPGDSIEVNFSDNYEALHIHVHRDGTRLIGRATYISDVIVGGPDPSMHAEATREACPTPRP